MLERIMLTGPRLSRGVTAWLAGLASCAYLLLFVAGRSLLPDFLFRDADKIQAQMDGASTYEGSSFDAVGQFFALFGPTLLDVLVVAIGIGFIQCMLARARHAGALGVALLLGAPCVFFNLFVASKDTLVVAISLLIVWSLARWRVAFTVAFGVGAYVVYALLVRRYFLLIGAAAAAVLLFRRAGRRGRIVLAGLLVLALLLLPSGAYTALLLPRDMAVDYLMVQSPFGARTSFHNLMPPDSFAAFCIDYVHAVVRLHLPLLFSPDPRGLAMQVFVIVAWRSARPFRHIADANPVMDVLACLVMGHIAVSMLFEPDLGSYVRHLSSVSLFCMTLLAARADAARSLHAGHQRPPDALPT